MTNIAEKYLDLISSDDWHRFLSIAVDKTTHMVIIIENERGPKRQKQAREIYAQFRQTVPDHVDHLAKAG